MTNIEMAIRSMQNLNMVLSITDSERNAVDLAIQALQEKAERGNNPPLTLEQLREMNGSPVWCVDSKGDGKWALAHDGDEVCTDADFGDWEFYCYGWKDGDKLNENGWLAYRYKKEG